MTGDENSNLIDGIAIIGISGRFPMAKNVTEFWENIRNGRECITFFSEEELALAGIDRMLLSNPHYVKARGILENIDEFDASFFGINPREAELMDPQHRILLECAWKALEDAGYDSDRYDGKIGIYAGQSLNGYLLLNVFPSIGKVFTTATLQAAIGNDKDSLTTNVSYRLNLKGPGITIQSSSSTSLVAVCVACQSLLSYQCDIALAGGITIDVQQKSGYLYEEGGILSQDGHCRAFDAESRGFVPGNGLGLVVLKRFEEAFADGDNIYAVIKGFAVNNDGDAKVSYTAPSVDAQADVIAEAQAVAGISPETIQYIEAHGTGTNMGDPIEVAALTLAFGAGTDKKNFCALGSVKTNVGHLDTAAGVTGLIKAAMALKHKVLPPSLHFKHPNPQIDFNNSPFYVNTIARPWEKGTTPRRAGVSSLGMGGTNAHVVLEEHHETYQSSHSRPYQILTLSAKTGQALTHMTENLVTYLKENKNTNIADAAYTLKLGRREFNYRKAVVCRDIDDAIRILETNDQQRIFSACCDTGTKAITFMCSTSYKTTIGAQQMLSNTSYKTTIGAQQMLSNTSYKTTIGAQQILSNTSYKTTIGAQHLLSTDQHSQYVKSTYDLYKNEIVYRQALDNCSNILVNHSGFNLIDSMFLEGGFEKGMERAGEKFKKTSVIQCIQFAVAYSLAELWMSLGIFPQSLIGYGFSELVTACLAGVFTLKDALKVVSMQGELIDDIPQDSSTNELTGEKFFTMLKALKMEKPSIQFISNHTGTWITSSEATDPHYWADLTQNELPFSTGIKELLKEPGRVFLEIGQGSKLCALVKHCMTDINKQAVISSLSDSVEPGDNYLFLMKAMSKLWCAGVNIDWIKFYENEKRQRISLPTYPFEHKRYWIDVKVAEKPAEIPVNNAGIPFDIQKPLCVIVADGDETNSLGAYFEKAGIKVVQVQNGAEFKRSDNVYTLNFSKSGDYEKLIKEIYNGKIYKGSGNDMDNDSSTEETLIHIFQELLGIDDININDNFFELGGHSLLATQLIARIHRDLSVEIPINVVFEKSTIAELKDYISRAGKNIYSALKKAAVRENYAASAAQKRIYILNKMEGQSTSYNLPGVYLMEGELDKDRLKETFANLIQRHEALRTSFEMIGNELVQKIHDTMDFEITYVQAEEGKVSSSIREFIRPFDLNKVPLVRVGLIEISKQRNILMCDMHHIISDGTSIAVLIKEFNSLYNRQVLPGLRIQYRDFSEWQNELFRSDRIRQQEEYWLNRFRGEIPVLNMPLDYPRPAVQSFEGNTIRFSFDKELTGALSGLASRHGATIYMVLLALFNVLLSKYTGQDDIIVGSPIAGRRHADLENVIGMFVNTLAMRNQPAADKTFGSFLDEVKANALQAYENQDYQFEELVENVQIKRDISRNPLFDVVLVQQNTGDASISLGDLRIRPYDIENLVTKFDITLNVLEESGSLYFNLEYSNRLFKGETMERMVKHFKNLLKEVVNNPNAKLCDIEMLTGEEKRRILYDFNNTEAQYPEGKTIHQLFEEQVERTPDNTAVVYEDKMLTYRELNGKSNQLARLLREKGVKPDSIVGIMVERSIEMIIGIMGILKAGGAFLPIDPEYPQERIRFMLEDSSVKILLTQAGLKAQINREAMEVIDLEDDEVYSKESTNLKQNNKITDLAYVIYTSGTTGKPKGVMIEQKGLLNFIESHKSIFKENRLSRMSQVSSISFDAMVLEIFPCILCGAGLYIVNKEMRLDPVRMRDWIIRNRITITFQSTAMAEELFKITWPIEGLELRIVSTGGDRLKVKPPKTLPFKVYNLYGPTEDTICTTCMDLGEADNNDKIPIGKPLWNKRIYILNKDNKLVPINVAGELCISGDGLARGYLNQPELTAEKFIPNPFEPGERMYRTGDLARWLPDGNIEYSGRIDQQVKIRGFRIELGEIESQLLKHKAIKEAAVIAKEDAGGSKYLAAYIVSVREMTVQEIREHLSKELPEYMIPSCLVQMDKLPMTPNGKVDRKALPEPGGSISTGVEYKPPTNATEEKLAGIWQEILGAAQVGINDNFFELGGHSLKVMNLASMIHKELNVDIDIKELFKHQTIAAQAAIIDDEKNKLLDLERYIGEIREMSDIEIDSLLKEK